MARPQKDRVRRGGILFDPSSAPVERHVLDHRLGTRLAEVRRCGVGPLDLHSRVEICPLHVLHLLVLVRDIELQVVNLLAVAVDRHAVIVRGGPVLQLVRRDVDGYRCELCTDHFTVRHVARRRDGRTVELQRAHGQYIGLLWICLYQSAIFI